MQSIHTVIIRLDAFMRLHRTVLILFFCAGFMQNSSSTKFPTFPSGSPRASSLATSSCPGTHLTCATFTSTSQTTGRFLQHAPPFRVLSPGTAALTWFLWASRSLNVDMEWLYGASESSNMEVDIGYLPQVGLSPSLCLVLGLSVYIFSI